MCEYLKCLEQEELYWYERRHSNWLLKGDNNTSFFHKCANGRKRKNNIIRLIKDGQTIEGVDNLLQHATEYYAELFGPNENRDVQLDPDLWVNLPKTS